MVPCPVAPGAGEDLVGHQHGHVAAHPVALPGYLQERCGQPFARDGIEGVDLRRVCPGGEVRIRARARRCVRSGSGEERLRVLQRDHDQCPAAGSRARNAASRDRGRRDSARKSRTSLRPRPARRGAQGSQRLRPAQARVNGVAPHGKRGADDIVRRKVGQGAAVVGQQARDGRAPAAARQGCAPTRPSARRRRSPRRPARRARFGGHVGQGERVARVSARRPVQPGPGVDLVDQRVRAPGRSVSIRVPVTCASQSACRIFRRRR
ncbi:MAG: hypothetical protein KatS3mg051_0696 [Anaerolineae bacterium]|nr:MAG: hypothetical protein KatS3mg051_0696 [Anaerolineae bacterium]